MIFMEPEPESQEKASFYGARARVTRKSMIFMEPEPESQEKASFYAVPRIRLLFDCNTNLM
jgi:hypothetical protein